MPKNNDVVIIGNGVAAKACAIALSNHGIKSLRLAPLSRARDFSVGEHLPPEAKPIMQQLGITNLLEQERQMQSPAINSYWGSNTETSRAFIWSPLGDAYNLDRVKFDTDLECQAQENGGEILEYTSWKITEHNKQDWTIALSIGSQNLTIKSRLLIDASGRSATVAHRLSAKVKRYDQLIGLYCICERSNDTHNNMLIDAQEHGWWYSIPISKRKIITVFMTDFVNIPKGSLQRARYWEESLEIANKTRLRVGTQNYPKIRVVDAATKFTEISDHQNWLAIGDAAMAFDPITGSGITKALRDALEAAELAVKMLNNSPNNISSLTAQRAHRFENYLRDLHTAYLTEQRYSKSPFWQQRHSPLSPIRN